MCGIAGLLSDKTRDHSLGEIIDRMTAALVHRGPDAEGRWADAQAGIALGHRRLAILDLSEAGHQPMVSPDGRYVISYNGEVYNFRSLRKELEQASCRLNFRGGSDTEVVLAAIATWGVTNAVKRFVGMFAFAVWDRHEHVLHLVRDRMGEKPLYYGWLDGDFVFASELKALQHHPAWTGEIDRDALASMIRLAYVPSPLSIYQGIHKLPAGHILSLNFADERHREARISQYWSARDFFDVGQAEPIFTNESQAVARLEELLCAAIRDQMVADVPLGTFLSGGIDSTLVVALMQQLTNQPVESFTIGFHQREFNEANHAKAAARHLGTDHTELYVSPQNAIDAVAEMPTVYDEPFADPSQIPTFLLAQLTRKHVTVSLSGDGADELFGGYRRYLGVPLGYRWNRRLGPVARRAIARMLSLGLPAASPVQRFLGPLLPKPLRSRDVYRTLSRLNQVLPMDSPAEYYTWAMSRWRESTSVVLGCNGSGAADKFDLDWPDQGDFTLHMMNRDLMTYLPDDILVKVDRATMAFGLESRAPFLDHRVVEFAWQVPLAMKIRGGKTKWLLRELLYKYVPAELVDRPKQGFGAPISRWLKGPLREWAEALLAEPRLKREGFFDARRIRRKWSDHLSGKVDYLGNDLWNVLMFQAWMEQSTRPQQSAALLSTG